jgi:hypothetical protein
MGGNSLPILPQLRISLQLSLGLAGKRIDWVVEVETVEREVHWLDQADIGCVKGSLWVAGFAGYVG